MTDARVAALADQVMAADADALAEVGRLAGVAAATGPVLVLKRYPFHDRLLDRLRVGIADAMRSGQPPTCSHVSFTRPAVMHWLASRPGRFRCASCLNQAMGRERGREKCALCGRRGDLHAGAFRLPPSSILERDERPPAVLAGVVAHWILCAGCLSAD
jgi:hypothetical protein